jgi:hypothetical protein
LRLRKHAQSFRENYQRQNDSVEADKNDELRRKAAALLGFDFEAAVRLKAWDDASQLVKVGISFQANPLGQGVNPFWRRIVRTMAIQRSATF